MLDSSRDEFRIVVSGLHKQGDCYSSSMNPYRSLKQNQVVTHAWYHSTPIWSDLMSIMRIRSILPDCF